MNVLDAIRLLEDLQKKIIVLEKAIFMFESAGDNIEARHITEIKDEIIKKAERLRAQLENTPLVELR